MDNFMSKLSQRIGAQDTIKANFMAETAEKEQLKKQLEENGAILQSMRNLYLKQEENTERFLKLAEQLESVKLENTESTDLSALVQEIKECISRSDEFTHKECVKVYRNVQALLDAHNTKVSEYNGTLEAQITAINTRLNGLKVPDESAELNDIKALSAKAAASARSNKVWLVFATLIGIANLACMLLIHFGLL